MTYARLATAAVFTLSTATLVAAQIPVNGPTRTGQTPQQIEQPQGAIWGVVVSSTTGQPVDRVRLRLSGDGLRGSRTVYSAIDGRFAFLNLPAGSFTLSGSKTGYVGISYGQRSPHAGRAGTPIQLAEGQQIDDLTFTLPPGGVITGIVFDELNRPSVGTRVRVMAWEYESGERELNSAGSATTDDRGIYRVYGLPPGEYLVSAQAGNDGVEESAEMQFVFEQLRQQNGGATGSLMAAVPAPPIPTPDGAPDEPTVGYAPAYYPGTLDLSSAAQVSVDVSQVMSGVDFMLQQVPLVQVEGTVIAPPGVNARSLRVRLYNTGHDVPGVGSESSRVRDGRFSFSEVPPGQYRAVATGEVRVPVENPVEGEDDEEDILYWASTDVGVAGANVGDLTLFLQPGQTVSGRIAYDGSGTPPQSRRIRVTLEPYGQAAEAAGADDRRATVDENGNFTITGVVPARYRVEASGVQGWTVASANLGGLDAMDFGLEVSPAQDIDALEVVFSGQDTQLTGRLQDALGRPTADYTVVVFPSDARYWLPNARRIQATRPSTVGQFSFSGLPAGAYRVAAVTNVPAGIWYDPAFLEQLNAASIPFTLQPGQVFNQDLQVGR